MIRSLLRSLRHGITRFVTADSFLRRSAVLASGTACGQAITILSAPLLTRLYSTADFGHLQAFLSVFTMASVVSSLRYETAILVPDDDDTAAALALLAALATGCVALLAGAGLFCWNALGLGADGLLVNGGIWLLPLSVLGGGWNQVATHWCIRHGDYDRIAKMKVWQGAAQAATQSALGFAHIGGAGLLLGHLAGRTAGTASIVRSSWRSRPALFRSAANWSRMYANGVRYRDFPLVGSLSTLVNTAALSVTPLMIGHYFGAGTLGLYGLVDRTLTMSAILICQAMSQVYMNSAARLAATDPEALGALFLRTTRRLAVIGAGPSLIMVVAGPMLFPLIFGSAWTGAGTFARILTPCAYVAFIVWPLMPTLMILERQSLQLRWDLARLGLVCAGFFVVHAVGGSATAAVAVNAAILTTMYVVHAVLSYRAVRQRPPRRRLETEPEGLPA